MKYQYKKTYQQTNKSMKYSRCCSLFKFSAIRPGPSLSPTLKAIRPGPSLSPTLKAIRPGPSLSPTLKAMSKLALPLPRLSLVLLILFLSSGGTFNLVHGSKTWCVAKPSSDDQTLITNLNWACSQVDCTVLQKGCPCYYPNILISHASVAMNLYYQAKGRNPWNCVFKDSALVVMSDPSFGNCLYPFI